MTQDENGTKFSRRSFLETSSGALAIAGAGPVVNLAAQ